MGGRGEALRRAAAAAGAAAAASVVLPAAAELRVKRAARPLTDRWQQMPVEPRGSVPLGISFRPLQATALGLDPEAALRALLAYPFQLIRLSAYWNRLEPGPGRLPLGELDRQLDAAEQAGKQVIVCVGPVKAFGYPEFFVPAAPPESAAARRRPGHARRAPAAAGGRDRVPDPRRRAIPGA